MPRRTIRINYKVQLKRTVRWQQTTTTRLAPLPAPRQAPPRLTTTSRTFTTSPLAGIRRAAADYVEETAGVSDAEKQFDVFISHASEDQGEVVRPLVNLLEQQHGLAVWFSGSVLGLGASLRRSIDAGLRNSRFGVVVLSQNFFGKEWPNIELDGLVTRSVIEGRQLILPIWHNVNAADVAGYSLTLADKVALSTAKTDLTEIARQIAEAVRAE